MSKLSKEERDVLIKAGSSSGTIEAWKNAVEAIKNNNGGVIPMEVLQIRDTLFYEIKWGKIKATQFIKRFLRKNPNYYDDDYYNNTK